MCEMDRSSMLRESINFFTGGYQSPTLLSHGYTMTDDHMTHTTDSWHAEGRR